MPYEVEGDNIIAQYAYVSRNYTEGIYSLMEIFERLPSEYSTYLFEIYTHDRWYDFIVDSESQKILFGDYSHVTYLPSVSPGNTIYDVVLESFNDTVFQQIKECVFNNVSCNNEVLNQAWFLVEWTDLNVKYEFLKFSPYIYDPLTFMKRKSGVCIDYAVFYAAGLLAIGFDETYVLEFNTTTSEMHAVAGIEYDNNMLILEQHLPIMELQDYIQYSETILNTSIVLPIYTYKIKYVGNDFTVDFFKLDLANYEDYNPLDGITDDFAKDVAQSLSQKLNASITNTALQYDLKWSWTVLRFYAQILHTRWVEYVSNLISITSKGFCAYKRELFHFL